MNPGLLTFWGKARPTSDATTGFHPALLHCIDVAAAAEALREEGFARGLGKLTPALAFLAGLHDIGKFTRGFQQICPELWPAGTFGEISPVSSPRHDTTGYWLLRLHCGSVLDAVFPGTGPQARAALLQAIGGHHGSPPILPPDQDDDPYPTGLCPKSAAAAKSVAETLAVLFQPPAIASISTAEACHLSWRLAGVVTLADWLGSGSHFPYFDTSGGINLDIYFREHAMPHARAALVEAGLRAAKGRPFGGVRGLFPKIITPSPSQAWAEKVDLGTGPIMALIEDVTGSGKTEAALTLAHRLIANQLADGLFVALPTMATAGAMFERLADSYRGLFTHDTVPSLAMAHGRAKLDVRFTETILPDSVGFDVSDQAISSSSQCTAWLADGGRKALLAQVGVGTVDQALLAVLPVRHAALRQLGLARKVLIVDEVHAYDHYMRMELAALLRMHASGGGSAILLSATLTQALRGQLLAAFTDGLGASKTEVTSKDYPLVTLASASGLTEAPCLMRDNFARVIPVRRLEDASRAVLAIAEAVAQGAAVAWIRNTVDDAIAGQEELSIAGVNATVFHARFAMADRLRIESLVLGQFGKASTSRAGAIVATQVIEMSLDLDFDLIVTDMAPADMVIQRAGRLWRHPDRKDRPAFMAPELLLVGPDPVSDPLSNWLSAALPGTAAIYPAPLVWRSARALLQAGVIDTPGNVRALVEAAYDEAGSIPDGLERAEQKRVADRYTATALAQMNVLSFEKGYSTVAGAWGSDTRTPTRLEDEPTVTLRLAKLDAAGRVVPWAQDLSMNNAWALSEVRVAARRVMEVVIAAAARSAADAARAMWGRWERDAVVEIKLVLLVPDGEVWRAEVLDARMEQRSLFYCSVLGLRWTRA